MVRSEVRKRQNFDIKYVTINWVGKKCMGDTDVQLLESLQLRE
jgi:hypothetical protein